MICSGSITFGFVDEMSLALLIVPWNLKSGATSHSCHCERYQSLQVDYSVTRVHVWLLQLNHTSRPGLSVYCYQRKGALSRLSLRHCVIGGPSSSEQGRGNRWWQAHTNERRRDSTIIRSCSANPKLTSLGSDHEQDMCTIPATSQIAG